MIFGIIGAFIGIVIGLIIGVIVKEIMGNIYDSIIVCQNCGYTGKIGKQKR